MHIRCFLGDDFLRERALREAQAALREKHKDLQEVTLHGDELDLSQVREALETETLFGGPRILVIHNVDHAPTELAELLEKHKRAEGVYLFLEAEKLDRRGKLYRLLKARQALAEFPSPERNRLPALVKELLREKGLRLAPEALRYLLEVTGFELRQIANEIEKLALYKPAGAGELTLAEVEGVVWGSGGGELFRFLDALSERQAESLSLLKATLAAGEDPGKVFFMVAAQLRALLLISSLAAEGRKLPAIAAQTGQPPWLVRKRLAQSRNFSERELIRLLELLHREDLLIKRGQREPVEALFRVALAVVRPNGAEAKANGVPSGAPPPGGTLG